MPYIDPKRRFAIRFDKQAPENAGELNFILTITLLYSCAGRTTAIADLTALCERYLADRANEAGGAFKYQFINDVLGALDGAAREFIRRRAPFSSITESRILQAGAADIYARIAAPYEDSKITQNGDIDYE